MTERDITKLPVWAQRKIEVLQRDISYLNSKLAAGPENSNTFADPYSSAPRPLGDSPTVEFVVGPDKLRDRIRVRVEGDEIDVNGSTIMTVRPRAGNSVRIGIDR